MILTTRKIAITQKDDASNSGDDTTVVLSAINEGADGSAVFGFTNEHTDISVEGMQTYTHRADPQLDLRVLKPTGDAYTGQTELAQIKEWVSNQEDVFVSVLGLNGVVFFGDYGNDEGSGKMVANEQLSDADIFAAMITSGTAFGFDPDTALHQNGVWVGKNLLGGYEFKDPSSSGIAAGWSKTGGTTSFASGEQTFSTTGSSDVFIYRDVFFPFDGEQVTASVNVTAATVTGSASLDIAAYDASDTIIGSASTQSITSTGSKSVSKTLPASTQYVRVRLKVNDADIDFKEPMLALGTNTTYTKF